MFIAKLKNWLRNWLIEAPTPPQMGGILNPVTVSDGAGALVERSRAYDQNATALICEIRDRAKAGSPKAKKMAAALAAYIQKNPIQSFMSFGQEELEIDQLCEEVNSCFGSEEYPEIVKLKVPDIASRSVNKAVVTLANGPSLLSRHGSTLLQDVSATLEEDEQKAFITGYRHGVEELNSIPRNLQLPFILGHILGSAKRIQAVRLPGMPISVLSPSLGAELGE
jgi:hypothetical protein